MTTHYTSRPLLASDAPHVARIDAMQSENPMGAEQIRKMVSRQHIGGLVVENSEGVIVAWCMHLRDSITLHVIRLQMHIEFTGEAPVLAIIEYLKGRNVKEVLVSIKHTNKDMHRLLYAHGFSYCMREPIDSMVIMEYTP
jgi:hypothetical protein